jgi:hypothetical protein
MLNLTEAATQLGISTRTLERYTKQGIIEARTVPHGRTRRNEYTPEAVAELADKLKAGTVRPAVDGLTRTDTNRHEPTQAIAPTRTDTNRHEPTSGDTNRQRFGDHRLV